MIRRSAKAKRQSKRLGHDFHVSQFALAYLRTRILAHNEVCLTEGNFYPHKFINYIIEMHSSVACDKDMEYKSFS